MGHRHHHHSLFRTFEHVAIGAGIFTLFAYFVLIGFMIGLSVIIAAVYAYWWAVYGIVTLFHGECPRPRLDVIFHPFIALDEWYTSRPTPVHPNNTTPRHDPPSWPVQTTTPPLAAPGSPGPLQGLSPQPGRSVHRPSDRARSQAPRQPQTPPGSKTLG